MELFAVRYTIRAGGRSWAACSEPCGTGWNGYYSGWRGVKCNREGGRITKVSRNGMGVPSREIRGDVTGWGALTEATYMCVHPRDGCYAVVPWWDSFRPAVLTRG
jgi:hypothetical protein